MKFSSSQKKSAFDDPKNYYPNPQHYQNRQQIPPTEYKMSFSKAPRFESKSIDSSPTSQVSGMSPLNENLKIQELVQVYQRNKRGVFKSTFKNVKNAIELSPEYGEGLMQIMHQYNNEVKRSNLQPGPADYSPSFSVVQKRTQSQLIQPVSFSMNNSSLSQKLHQDTVQILIENKVPKIGLLPKIENDKLKVLKAYSLKQPKQGTLRKAKIAKNIFDQAKADEFDPSPENSSIELFVLRQKLLGPAEVPPPGHYYDSEKFSSFQLKKTSSVNIHFDSTEQRIMTFGNAISQEDDDYEEGEDEQRNKDDEKQRQENQEKTRKSIYSQLSQEVNRSSVESQQDNVTIQSQRLTQNNSRVDNQNSKLRNKSYQTYYHQNQSKTSFGKSDRSSFFDIFKNNYPGPGTYSIDINNKLKEIEQQQKHKQDIYFQPSFGSGCKRFFSLKTLQI